jgi:hypothetical protein
MATSLATAGRALITASAVLLPDVKLAFSPLSAENAVDAITKTMTSAYITFILFLLDL